MLYTGEDRFGIVNRGAAGTHDPGVQGQQIVQNPAGLEEPALDTFAHATDEAGGDYMLTNRDSAVTRQVCPAPKEVVTPITVEVRPSAF